MMDPVMLRLHDRATQGETLTPDEQEQLEQWYAAEDEAEIEILAPVIAQTQSSSLSISVLRTQLEVALTQLKTIAQQIEQVMLENEALRQELAELKQQFMVSRAA